MADIYKIIRTFQISPLIAIRKFKELLIKKVKKSKNNIDDNLHLSFSDYENFKEIRIKHIINYPSDDFLNANADIINILSDNSINHKFDLLGSGFVKIGFDKSKNDTENYIYNSNFNHINKNNFSDQMINKGNIGKSKNILNLIDKYNPDYQLIDWQTDIKSGYRWYENISHKKIRYDNLNGVDIKVPWELGRMQDLIFLAYSYKLNQINSSLNNNEKYANEFKSRVIDFIGSNPPGYGVQWKCAMDVSIRLINFLCVYDLFSDSKYEFDDDFNRIFFNSIYNHILFIIDNIEWSSGMRGNHYFTNIVSLLGASVYLSDNKNDAIASLVNELLPSCINNIAKETLYQFNEDGSNFEASIPYHFLCTEMLFYGIRFINSLDNKVLQNIKSNINNQYYTIKKGCIQFNDLLNHRISKIIDFTKSICDSNNSSFNIGDNDSGKYIKFNAYYKLSDNILSPDLNNYTQIIDLIDSIIDSKNVSIDHIIYSTCNNNIFDYHKTSNFEANNIISYNNFGLYLFKNKNYFSAIRCGSIGQREKGGHSHNDQLSLALKVNNRDIFVDNGTYLYTAEPAMRNLYRSTFMHNTLSIEGFEQNKWEESNIDDLFWIKKHKSKAKIFEKTKNSLKAVHYGFNYPCKREFLFNDSEIEGIDNINTDENKQIHFYLNPEIQDVTIQDNSFIINFANRTIKLEIISENCSLNTFEYLHSPSYGCLIQATELRINTKEKSIAWKISIY